MDELVNDMEYFVWVVKDTSVCLGWSILGYIPLLSLNLFV